MYSIYFQILLWVRKTFWGVFEHRESERVYYRAWVSLAVPVKLCECLQVTTGVYDFLKLLDPLL